MGVGTPNRSPVQSQYLALVIYYWVLRNSVNYLENYDGTGYKYYLLTLPILAFVAFNVHRLWFAAFDRATVLLAGYVLAAGMAAGVRGDFALLGNIVFFGVPIIIFLNARVRINHELVNWLFLAQVLISVATYYSDVNKYGFWPGQSQMNLHMGMSWRTNLFHFASPAYSGFFALMVVLMNWGFNQTRSRWPYILLGGYWLFFSGARIALLSLFAVLGFALIARVVSFRARPLYGLAPLGYAVALIAMAVYPVLLLGLFGLGDGFSFLARYALKTEAVSLNLGDVVEGLVRVDLWRMHMTLFFESFPFGRGSFELGRYFDWAGVGSDAMLTTLLVRDGFAALPFLLFLWAVFWEASKRRNRMAYAAAIILFGYFLNYGGFLHPRDPQFLILLGLFHSAPRDGTLFGDRLPRGPWAASDGEVARTQT